MLIILFINITEVEIVLLLEKRNENLFWDGWSIIYKPLLMLMVLLRYPIYVCLDDETHMGSCKKSLKNKLHI